MKNNQSRFAALLRVATTACVCLATAQVHAAGVLGVANAYNVFVFNNFTETGSDTGGRLAAGGNASFSGTYAVTQSLLDPYTAPNNDSLVVGGAIVSGTANVLSGNAFLKLNGAGSASMTGGGTLTVGGSSPINFATEQASLTAYSIQLSQQTANGTVANNGYGTITLTGGSSTLDIFNLNFSDLGGSNTININNPSSATVLINVAGTSGTTTNAGIYINGAGANGDSTTAAAKVLFNFYQATSVALGGSFLGTILAPTANVTGTYGQIDGGLIAKSFTGPTEFHDILLNGTLPANTTSASTPEPGTNILLGLGLIALGSRKFCSAKYE